MRIAILGAAGTGKHLLAQELARALPANECTVSVIPEQAGLLMNNAPVSPIARDLQRNHDLTLLTGLDLPAAPLEIRRREQADSLLRKALLDIGIIYRVIYGTGPKRAEQALRLIRHALRLPNPDHETRLPSAPERRWVWSCEKCSDPVCEHRLFTEKLGMGQP